MVAGRDIFEPQFPHLYNRWTHTGRRTSQQTQVWKEPHSGLDQGSWTGHLAQEGRDQECHHLQGFHARCEAPYTVSAQ